MSNMPALVIRTYLQLAPLSSKQIPKFRINFISTRAIIRANAVCNFIQIGFNCRIMLNNLKFIWTSQQDPRKIQYVTCQKEPNNCYNSYTRVRIYLLKVSNRSTRTTKVQSQQKRHYSNHCAKKVRVQNIFVQGFLVFRLNMRDHP